MIYLLIAIALCLLVPWLPYLMYRRLPRRMPPPLSEGQLHRLAGQLKREGGQEAITVDAVEASLPNKDITPQPRATSEIPSRSIEAAEGRNQSPGNAENEPGAPMLAADHPHLTWPSYRTFNFVLTSILLVAMFAFAAGWAVLFHFLAEGHARSFAPAVFLFKPFPYGVFCAFPAFYLGICTASPFMGMFARLLLGRRRFLEFLFWDEGRICYTGPMGSKFQDECGHHYSDDVLPGGGHQRLFRRLSLAGDELVRTLRRRRNRHQKVHRHRRAGLSL
jgi:hypothetical protein